MFFQFTGGSKVFKIVGQFSVKKFNFYVNKYTNALTTLLKSTKNEDNLVNIFAIKLEKVLRGPITEWAEQIFSK